MAKQIGTEMLKYGDQRLFVSAKEIKSFKDLKISTSLETEDQDDDNEKYVRRKNVGVTEVSFTVVLSSFAGVNVKAEALAWHSAGKKSDSYYLYLSGEKPFTFRVLMTKVSIENVIIGPGGIWISAEVKVTMKQSTKANGQIKGDGDKKKKKVVKHDGKPDIWKGYPEYVKEQERKEKEKRKRGVNRGGK